MYKIKIISSKEVRKLFPIKHAVSVIESAFAEFYDEKSIMPSKVYLDLPQYQGDFRAMPAYSEKANLAGLKWVNSHDNSRFKDLPSVMGMLIVNDPKTGEPLAIMDGTSITNIRTGAAGAVAIKYLSSPQSKKVTFVGAGQQAVFQLLGLVEVRDIQAITIVDPSKTAQKNFINQAKHLQLPVTVSDSIKDAVKDADIIITSTPSRKPVIKKSWLKPNAHINAIGADAKGKQELESSILKEAAVVVDDIEQAIHSGEINVAMASKELKKSDIAASLGEVVSKLLPENDMQEQLTVFDSTGLAIQDIAAAAWILEQANRTSMGKKIRL